jgi:hypothetical protein
MTKPQVIQVEYTTTMSKNKTQCYRYHTTTAADSEHDDAINSTNNVEVRNNVHIQLTQWPLATVLSIPISN